MLAVNGIKDKPNHKTSGRHMGQHTTHVLVIQNTPALEKVYIVDSTRQNYTKLMFSTQNEEFALDLSFQQASHALAALTGPRTSWTSSGGL